MTSPIGNGALRYVGGVLGVPSVGPQFISFDVPPALVFGTERLAERGAAPGQSLGYMALFRTDAHAAAGALDVQTNIWSALNASLAEGSRVDPGTHGLWIHRSCVSASVDANFASANHALVRTLLPGGSNSRDIIFSATAVTNFSAVPLLPPLPQWLYAPNGSLWITQSTAQVAAVDIFHQLFMWAGVLGSTPPGAA